MSSYGSFQKQLQFLRTYRSQSRKKKKEDTFQPEGRQIPARRQNIIQKTWKHERARCLWKIVSNWRQRTGLICDMLE